MKRLGVNIDHVATVRNARGEQHPDPYHAALQVVKMGADSVTIHLREDRRHIKDLDAKKICKSKKILVNLEISMNNKIISNALKIKPDYICIVPENRKEVTTEGGLNLIINKKKFLMTITHYDEEFYSEYGWASCFECDVIFYNLEAASKIISSVISQSMHLSVIDWP